MAQVTPNCAKCKLRHERHAHLSLHQHWYKITTFTNQNIANMITDNMNFLNVLKPQTTKFWLTNAPKINQFWICHLHYLLFFKNFFLRLVSKLWTSLGLWKPIVTSIFLQVSTSATRVSTQRLDDPRMRTCAWIYGDPLPNPVFVVYCAFYLHNVFPFLPLIKVPYVC